MSLWQKLSDAIFTGDREWAWRRRAALASVLVELAGILHSTFFDFEVEHAALVMNSCQAGLATTLGIYVAGAVTDDHLKRGKAKPGEESVNAKP